MISSSVVVRLRLRSHRKGKRDHLKTARGQRRNDTEHMIHKEDERHEIEVCVVRDR